MINVQMQQLIVNSKTINCALLKFGKEKVLVRYLGNTTNMLKKVH